MSTSHILASLVDSLADRSDLERAAALAVLLEDLLESLHDDGAALGRLELLQYLQGHLRVMTRDQVHIARKNGATWEAVGRSRSMSKQAAQQRFAASCEVLAAREVN